MRIAAYALTALVLACATAPRPTRSDIMRQVSRDYPREQFIVGTATATSPEQAEKDAVVDCAAGMNSSIDASLTSVSEESNVNGRRSASNKVKSKVDEKVKTDAAALIRPVRELTTQTDTGWVAVAILDRRELEAKYRTESDTVLSQVESIWRRIVADPGAQTVGEALCEAEKLEPQLDANAVERTVTTGTQAMTDEQKALRAQVQAIREKRRQQSIAVIARDAVNEANGRIADLLAAELTKRGVTTRLADGASCDAVPSGVLVNVQSAPTCAPNAYGGSACDVSFRTLAKNCMDGSTVLEAPSSSGRGQHASREDLAKKAAYTSIDGAKYVGDVATRLGAALGFGCRQR